MANLAALIREAERVRGAVRIVGPESGPPAFDDAPREPMAPASSWDRYPEPADCAQPERNSFLNSLMDTSVSEEERPVSKIQLTEDQMEQLRASMASTPEVMTLSEAAAYLRVGRTSVLDMVHDEGLPAAKLAGKWRFKRSAVDQWLEIHLSHHPRSIRN